MLYLANPCGPAVIDSMQAGTLGYIDTPAQGNKRPEGVVWCADNGCFSDKWDEEKWWRFLVENNRDSATCLFAVAPDVVGDAIATIRKSIPWLQKIRELGYPVAFVAQNGLTVFPVRKLGVLIAGGEYDSVGIDWGMFDALFLGGSPECLPCGYVYAEKRKPKRDEPCPHCARRLTEWKTGAIARDIVTEAKAHGKWVHMGRVNSERRFEYARAIGCDSADGTFLTFGPDVNLPRLLAWTRNNEQDGLFT